MLTPGATDSIPGECRGSDFCNHQIQILHRGASSALPQIVKYGSQQDLPRLFICTHHQLQIISPVKRLRIKVRQLFSLLQRHHLYMGCIQLVPHKTLMQLRRIHPRRQ